MLQRLFSFWRYWQSKLKTELPETGSSVFTQKDQQEENSMWLIVGLGNPGEAYARNRHNAGFMAVDAIANAAGLSSKFRNKFQGEFAEGNIEGEKVLLLKPQTYMNLSGESVQKAAQFYKVEPSKIIVFHDEIDIDPATVRVKKGGGNAGHNGLKSIQAHLNTAEYWRVRIGIGRSPHGEDVSDYVLDNFSKAEQVWLEPLLEVLAKEVNLIFSESPKAYAQKINVWVGTQKKLT